MTRPLLWCALALPLMAPANVALAQSHHHGTAEASLVLSEAGALSLALEIPAGDVLGFERLPATGAEQEAVAGAIAVLSEPLALFSFPAAAGCAVVNAVAELEAEGGHAELAAEYVLQCRDAAALDRIEAGGLFVAFAGVHEVALAALVNGRAVQAEMSGSAPAAGLR
jgi:hypothetical protein